MSGIDKRIEWLWEAIDSLRKQGLKNAKRFKHKRFKGAKQYWLGFAQGAACARALCFCNKVKNEKKE